MDVVQLLQDLSHFEEAVYFITRSLQKFLVLILSERTENNIVCSSINSPSNLVNNVFASVHYLGFNVKLLFFFT